MDQTAVLNRSVWDVTGLAHEEWRTVGDNAHGRRVSVPFSGSTKGKLWFGSQLMPKDFRPRGDFEAYGTSWEQRYSALISNRVFTLTFVPVASDRSRVHYVLPAVFGGTQNVYQVVAHHGTVSVDEIIVPRKFATKESLDARRDALEDLLDQDIEAYAEQDYPPYGEWVPFAEQNNLGPNNFTVLTDPDGRILAVLDAFGNEPGLESEDPLSYLMLAPAIVDIVKVGGRLVLRVASRRAAVRAAEAAAKRAALGEIRTLTESELKSIRGGAVGKKPPLMSAEELNKEVTQIQEGMGPKRRLQGAERTGALDVLNVLQRLRENPKDWETIWKDLGKRRVQKMRYGTYARDGWIEIDVLEHNPGGLNQMRVIFRVKPDGDLEARLLQGHGGSFKM
jgi:hypothetical protein